jgi:hypothetical protein
MLIQTAEYLAIDLAPKRTRRAIVQAPAIIGGRARQ